MGIWAIVFFISICIEASGQTTSFLKPDEVWINVFMLEQKVGYAHEVVEKGKYNNEEVFLLKNEIYMKLKMFGQEIESRETSLFYVGLDMKPRAFIFNVVAGSATQIVRGEYLENRLEIEAIKSGKTKKMSLDAPEDFGNELIVQAEMVAEGLKIGQKRTFTIFNPQFMKFIKITLEVIGEKVVDIKGEEKNAFVLQATFEGLKQMSTIIWLEPNGDFLQATMNLMNMRIERTTKAEALESFPGLNYVSTWVFANTLLPRRARITELEVKPTIENGDVIEDVETVFIEDTRQHFEKRGDEAILIIQAPTFTNEESDQLPISADEEVLKFLEPTDFVESKDEEIAQIAQGIAGDEKNAWVVSKRISRWVSEYLKATSDVPFGTAKEALNLKKGDCTEHAVLFAALARAAGIPTKVCLGLTYTNIGAFLYHAWPEVYVGKWVPIDPALGQMQVDATHLKMFEGVMTEEEQQTHVLNILSVIGKLSLEVKDYKTDDAFKSSDTQKAE